MPNLAAICQKCHRPFPSGFFIGAGASGNTFIGCEAGPCPWCGAPWGVVPDGVLDVDADDVVRLSKALPTTNSDLIKLAGILQEADLRPGADTAAVVARINAEVPSARPLMAMLRDPAFGNVTVF